MRSVSFRLRRPVVPSASSLSSPTVATAPGMGTRPSAWASRPATVSTSVSSISTSNNSPRSSTGRRGPPRGAGTPPGLVVGEALARRPLHVVLVGDLADDLFQDVLNGDQTGRAAV